MGHSMLQTIKDRMVLYREAEGVAAAQGETSRARRAARGLKTLQELERKAARGGAVAESEIPPPISTGRRQEATGGSAVSSIETSPDSEQAPPPPPHASRPSPPAVPRASPPVARLPSPPPPRRASPPPPASRPPQAAQAPVSGVPSAGPASQLQEIRTWRNHYKVCLTLRSSPDTHRTWP